MFRMPMTINNDHSYLRYSENSHENLNDFNFNEIFLLDAYKFTFNVVTPNIIF